MPPQGTQAEDVELGDIGDREHDAFLPDTNASKPSPRSSNAVTKHLPPRLREFLENLSKIKVRNSHPNAFDETLTFHVTIDCPYPSYCFHTLTRLGHSSKWERQSRDSSEELRTV